MTLMPQLARAVAPRDSLYLTGCKLKKAKPAGEMHNKMRTGAVGKTSNGACKLCAARMGKTFCGYSARSLISAAAIAMKSSTDLTPPFISLRARTDTVPASTSLSPITRM